MKKILLITLVMSTGCVVTENNTERGALGGSVIGAGLGAIIGHQSGETGKGALIGGAAGALPGRTAFSLRAAPRGTTPHRRRSPSPPVRNGRSPDRRDRPE